MNPKAEFATIYGLSLLSENDMRNLLYSIVTFETNGDIKKTIEFACFARKSINDKIIQKLREKEVSINDN